MPEHQRCPYSATVPGCCCGSPEKHPQRAAGPCIPIGQTSPPRGGGHRPTDAARSGVFPKGKAAGICPEGGAALFRPASFAVLGYRPHAFRGALEDSWKVGNSGLRLVLLRCGRLSLLVRGSVSPGAAAGGGKPARVCQLLRIYIRAGDRPEDRSCLAFLLYLLCLLCWLDLQYQLQELVDLGSAKVQERESFVRFVFSAYLASIAQC
ncbi:uncharacterized protein KNAG_0H00540 [Huiozyma naganishii CBS 8797]|uniref:Uncharacterized protein n=1 Tax=Huiozyma naganishii (strain ATCC MYA-139 / BCRC 22969 / CBS 8797 / KCTC 17520 / NBRC 10181 / NCYC 3082 / Yp74L-3) TaxID=1071383 RepID=J7R9F4_HUIN7|nr:hypothetical protein KNAG_0H00540 [Kazachstania naganishii CBS 8797]CCK71470.1 hypothetical protein KNAG_0H00540 [Kazachstania naganishii CBS 8797]